MRKLKNAPVNTLSGGEQQRVALARTMLKPGKLILADEPTGALDEQSAQISFNLLKGLCRKYKKTVIMVTHSMDLARQADRVVRFGADFCRRDQACLRLFSPYLLALAESIVQNKQHCCNDP